MNYYINHKGHIVLSAPDFRIDCSHEGRPKVVEPKQAFDLTQHIKDIVKEAISEANRPLYRVNEDGTISEQLVASSAILDAAEFAAFPGAKK